MKCKRLWFLLFLAFLLVGIAFVRWGPSGGLAHNAI